MKYHAFLSYNSKNIIEAEKIYTYLTNTGLNIFFDKKCIKPGDKYQKVMEAALKSSSSILVIIGEDNIGPWQEVETYMFQIIEHAHQQEIKIIPMLIGTKGFDKNNTDVPFFLSLYHSIKLDKSLNDPEKIFDVIEAIPSTSFALSNYERPLLEYEQELLLKDSVHFYNNNAAHYFERWKNDLPIGALWTFLKHVNKNGKGKKILDAGCGPGHHAEYFGKEGNEVIGLDLSNNFIKLATAQKHSNCNFIHADMRRLFEIYKIKNQFDAIWACGSCIHLSREALERQLNDFLAFLKPGGILGLSFQVDAPSVVQEDGRFFERYQEDVIKEKLKRHEFKILNVNYDYNDKSTTADKMKVKKWYNVVLSAPKEKDSLIFL